MSGKSKCCLLFALPVAILFCQSASYAWLKWLSNLSNSNFPYFLMRSDPTHFRHILNFFRDGTLCLDPFLSASSSAASRGGNGGVCGGLEGNVLAEILREASYYQVSFCSLPIILYWHLSSCVWYFIAHSSPVTAFLFPLQKQSSIFIHTHTHTHPHANICTLLTRSGHRSDCLH